MAAADGKSTACESGSDSTTEEASRVRNWTGRMWGGFQAVVATADGVLLGIYDYPDENNGFNTAKSQVSWG